MLNSNSQTVRMTETGAEEWRDAQDDSQEIDKKDLEHVFKAICGRRPDADGDQWSLICAA